MKTQFVFTEKSFICIDFSLPIHVNENVYTKNLFTKEQIETLEKDVREQIERYNYLTVKYRACGIRDGVYFQQLHLALNSQDRAIYFDEDYRKILEENKE